MIKLKKAKSIKIIFLILMLPVLFSFFFSGCDNILEEEYTDAGGKIYYLATDGVSFVSESYEIDENKKSEILAMEMLSEMKKSTTDYSSAIPNSVAVTGVEHVDEHLIISVSREYLSLDVVSRTLCNAGITFTLAQIEGVSGVRFEVENVPVTNSLGEVLTYTPNSFSSTSEEVMELYSVEQITLYLTNETGKELEKYSFEAAFLNNTSKERYILEQLMTWESDGHFISPIPVDTQLLSVSTRDGICYVNFNSAFTSAMIGINPDITLYSIVNSLTELPYVNFVQFTVNGESNISMGSYSLSNSFSSNWNYLKTEE